MDADVLRALRRLLDEERVLAAAVLVDGEPVAALLPFAVSADYSTLFIQASGLARHAKGLHTGAAVGVLVHHAATPERDPMQIPRLTVQATARILARESDAFATAAERLLARFPVVATTLGLGDFSVYALDLGRGRYVEGFARAVNVGPEVYRALVGLEGDAQ